MPGASTSSSSTAKPSTTASTAKPSTTASTAKSSTTASTAKPSTTGSTTVKSSPTSSALNDGRNNGVTTRYWDCCKASCGWSGKADVTSPVKTCEQNGITPVNVNTQSGCNNGGTAYMCNNQQPWNVSATLSYGYAAADIAVRDFLIGKKMSICFYYNRVSKNLIGVVLVIHCCSRKILLLVKN
jgi:hypothetical protein